MSDAQHPTVIAGRYELGEPLGRGGMAEVRKGTDTRLGRVVAVKRLRTDLASDHTFQQRFRREAHSSASLNHPSIVSVYDTGEEIGDDGITQPYIVMEYVAGRTLRDVIQEGRKILPERALEITAGVLSALDYSHRSGIIHRDIKPGNVMLTPSGDVKVMDFGIARAVSEAASTMTQTAAVVGTAQYLSPEQARGETVDSRSDVYSAGCLLYELLVGRPPFQGDSPVAVAYQHVREQPEPPSRHDPSLPAEIDRIVMKALAKRVEDRYQSASQMRDDIERYLAGRPVEAPAVPDDAPSTQVGSPPPTRPVEPSEPEPSRWRRRAPWIVAIAVLLVALLGLGVYGATQLDLFEDEPTTVAVPDVSGLSETDARAELTDAGFEVADDVQTETSDDVEEGLVLSVSPSDSYLDPGTLITLTLSAGPDTIELPDVTGDTYDEARQQLISLGFTVADAEDVDSDEAAGTVVSMRPEGGVGGEYAPGTEVTLQVSSGPKEIPDVVGLSQSDAEAQITAAGFQVYVAPTRTDPEQASGVVLEQSPTADAGTAPQGTFITIVVNDYVAPTTAPTTSDTPAPTTPTPAPTGLIGPWPTPVSRPRRTAGRVGRDSRAP